MHPLLAPYPPCPVPPNVRMSGPVAEALDPEDSASGFESEDGSIPNPITVQQWANEQVNKMMASRMHCTQDYWAGLCTTGMRQDVWDQAQHHSTYGLNLLQKDCQ